MIETVLIKEMDEDLKKAIELSLTESQKGEKVCHRNNSITYSSRFSQFLMFRSLNA
jgi:hypothetical protein